MEKKRITTVLNIFCKTSVDTPTFDKASRVLVKVAPKIEDQQLRRSIFDMNQIKIEEGSHSPKLKAHVEGIKQQCVVRLRNTQNSMPSQSNGGKIKVKVESLRDNTSDISRLSLILGESQRRMNINCLNIVR